jgi:ubiquinone/menaquinone biosynthesis C-methylase UbiE
MDKKTILSPKGVEVVMKNKEIKKAVKKRYAKFAQDNASCCPTCSCSEKNDITKHTEAIGYSANELKSIPESAILGLGCGNPAALADLKKGEIVLDLGSGAGIDVFLAANKVGERGHVIGVDMTEEMIKRAKKTAKENGYKNVEFRLGEIENLPVNDNTIDVIISNCVINLSPDKLRTFKEAFRVLKPGGRLMVSDLVTEGVLPDDIRKSFDAWGACIAGALEKNEYLETIKKAGFHDVKIVSQNRYVEKETDDRLVNKITSLKVCAYK